MALKQTDFQFENQSAFYRGKVRDVYHFDDKMAIVVSDRISAFDHILPRAIPYKGQVLNGVACHFLENTRHIVPNWLEGSPHPNVMVGHACKPIKLEMVVRAYLAGHAWRTYKSGLRSLCGVSLPEGLKESDKLPSPIITPATKAEQGHDEDISAEEILAKEIVSKKQWETLCHYSLALFEHGTASAKERGLILVDTKYEFGLLDGEIILIDEIHTPDSSRYYILEGYAERQAKGEKQKQLSKEFVREWLMENGFQGLEGQKMPLMDDDFVDHVTGRYIELYEKLLGKTFVKKPYEHLEDEIKRAIKDSF